MGNGVKYDAGKSRWELLPFDALEVVAQILTQGAVKYGDRNWEQGIDFDRLLGATLRHLSARAQGEVYDRESKLNHLAHAACETLFALALELRATPPVVRYYPEVPGAYAAQQERA